MTLEERMDYATRRKPAEQALADYRRLGYSERWIARRLKSIDIRKDLTDEWKARGVEDERVNGRFELLRSCTEVQNRSG